MKRLLWPAVIGLSLFMSVVYAAPGSAKPSAGTMATMKHSISGTIVSSTATNLVIKTLRGKEMTFMLDEKTSKPAQLKDGENIQVQYEIKNGKDLALKITERPMAASAKKSPGNIR